MIGESPPKTGNGHWSIQPRQLCDSAAAGALGALFGLYLYGELAQSAGELARSNPLWWARNLLAGVCLGGCIGFFLNALGPLRDGALLKLAKEATWGALAGAFGGALGLIVGELALGGLKGGVAGRAIAWAMLGLGLGLSQGIAHWSRQRLLYGVLGGGLGGFIGGGLFEAFRESLGQAQDPATSQGLGIVVLGGALGFFVAFVEQVLRRAWVQVLSGRQEGRAYLLAQPVNRLGLNEHAEVGLFGDAQIAREHAKIEITRQGEFLLKNLDAACRTQVNGAVVDGPRALADGDRIQLGQTPMVFRKR